MARWHLTSSRCWHDRAVSTCEMADLRPTGGADADAPYLRAYGKRTIPNVNFQQFSSGDWIAVAGTMIADNQLGGDALAVFHDAFISGGLERARSSAIGHYAVAIRHGDTLTAFTDEQGSLSLFYVEREGHYLLSNSLHVAIQALEVPEIRDIAVIAEAFQFQTVGEEAFFPGVKRLFGSQVFEADLASGQNRIREYKQTMLTLGDAAASDFETAVSAYADQVRDVFKQIATAPSIGVNTTGGMDTRTVLAALLNQGASPLLMYGVGNSELTDTRVADLWAARQLSDKLGLPLHIMDWAGNQPHDDSTLKKLFTRYGFESTVYSASEGLLRELEGGIEPYPTLHLGGYCPAFTNEKVWEMEAHPYCLDDLVGHLAPLAQHLTHEHRREYLAYIKQAAAAALTHAPTTFPPEGASLEQFVRARLFLSLRASMKNPNFFNQFSYYLAPFITKRLYDPLLTLPLAFRRGDRFQLHLTRMLRPELLEVPFYSGVRPVTIDPHTLTRIEAPTFAQRVNRCLPSWGQRAARRLISFCRPPARWVAEDEDQKRLAERSQRIRVDCQQRIASHPVTASKFDDFNVRYLPYLNVLRMLLFATDQVQEQATHRPAVPEDQPETPDAGH